MLPSVASILDPPPAHTTTASHGSRHTSSSSSSSKHILAAIDSNSGQSDEFPRKLQPPHYQSHGLRHYASTDQFSPHQHPHHLHLHQHPHHQHRYVYKLTQACLEVSLLTARASHAQGPSPPQGRQEPLVIQTGASHQDRPHRRSHHGNSSSKSTSSSAAHAHVHATDAPAPPPSDRRK